MRAVRMKKDKIKENPPKQLAILSFWSVKMPAKIETGDCVQVPHAISVSNKPWSESFL